jgi:uncharacterized membrane protein (DUF4010 family)
VDTLPLEADLLKLAVAAATGLVIGLERGWSHRTEAEGQRVAGLRTFTLAALAGGLCGILPEGALLLAVLLGAFAVIVAVAYYTQSTRSGDIGITTELALLATPVLGLLATRKPLEGIAVAALVAALLGFKQELHATIGRLARDEVLATVQLLIVAVVVLPLLPDEPVGPFGAINPRTVGWLVLLLLGVAYVGYFAVRVIGASRGLLLTAFLGGFTSSTAVTLAYARLARHRPEAARLLSAGISVACAMMAPRIWLLASAIEPDLGQRLAPALLVLGAVPAAYALYTSRSARADAPGDAVLIDNPFAIRAALLMAVAVAGLGVLIRGAEEWFGAVGAYSVAALSGILDVDAVSVALAEGARRGATALHVAGGAIMVAAIVNTLVKAGMALVLGGRGLGLRCLAVLGAGAAGALGMWFVTG